METRRQFQGDEEGARARSPRPSVYSGATTDTHLVDLRRAVPRHLLARRRHAGLGAGRDEGRVDRVQRLLGGLEIRVHEEVAAERGARLGLRLDVLRVLLHSGLDLRNPKKNNIGHQQHASGVGTAMSARNVRACSDSVLPWRGPAPRTPNRTPPPGGRP